MFDPTWTRVSPDIEGHPDDEHDQRVGHSGTNPQEDLRCRQVMDFDKDSYTQQFGIVVPNKTVQFEGNLFL